MTRRTINQMFGTVTRDMERQRALDAECAKEQHRQEEAAEARLVETITRRKLIDAIECVVFQYECSGTEDSDRIAAAFRKLAEALE